MARRGRRCGAAAVAVVGLGAIAGCGGSKYTYVNNSSEKTFFRVPSEYEIFRVEATAPTDRVAAPGSATHPWHVVFDAAPDPAAAHADLAAPAHVVGQAMVLPLRAELFDQLSPKALRSEFFGGRDPVDAAEAGEIELVLFEQLTGDGARQGSRVRYNVPVDGGWATVDQTTLLDPTAQRAYVLDVRCEASCFQANEDEISRIIESWQVRK